VTEFPEPRGDTADPAVLFARYLRFYRETVVRKARALPDDQLRTSRLPSGWTPIELVQHLAYMERRWLVWGFLGEQVADPWGDAAGDRWHVAEDAGLDDVVRLLEEVGQRTTGVLGEHRLDEIAAPGGRFDEEPPTLAWICFHVLQEYARHTGHLDVAVELAGGGTGE
jgi:uncharacterized damage-inducible protein DinB